MKHITHTHTHTHIHTYTHTHTHTHTDTHARARACAVAYLQTCTHTHTHKHTHARTQIYTTHSLAIFDLRAVMKVYQLAYNSTKAATLARIYQMMYLLNGIITRISIAIFILFFDRFLILLFLSLSLCCCFLEYIWFSFLVLIPLRFILFSTF